MELIVDVRAARVLQKLAISPKACDFAIVNALNKTALAIQARERARARSTFTLRKKTFVEQQVAVIRQAEKGSGFASVKDQRFDVRIAVGEKPRLLLSSFERGGERGPFTPNAKNVAVPAVGGARPSKRSQVPEEMQYKKLGLRKRKGRWMGKLATYMIPGQGVYQNVGTNRGKLLYAFKRRVNLKPILHFTVTARDTAAVRFPVQLTVEMSREIKRVWG